MALSVPAFAGAASVYAATQTMTDSTQFNRMDGVLKKNSAAEKKALKLIKGTWYTQGGVPYHNKYVFSGKTVKLYAPGSKKAWAVYFPTAHAFINLYYPFLYYHSYGRFSYIFRLYPECSDSTWHYESVLLLI